MNTSHLSASTTSHRLRTLSYAVDDTPHITVDGSRCALCHHPCVNFCPAACFTPNEQGGIDYYYVGCVECGTCLLLCSREAVTWRYPRGGYGISYRY